jgi:hypothetical protein
MIHLSIIQLEAKMAQANAPRADVIRMECAAFQRWTTRSQSRGNASGDQRAKRRFRGAFTATVIPIVVRDSAHPSASIGHDRCPAKRNRNNRRRHRQEHERRQEPLQPPDQLLTKKDVGRSIEPGGRRMDGNHSYDERARYDACPEYIDHLGYTHRQMPC